MEAAAADEIFIERQERERGIARLEQQAAELKSAAEARLDELPPDKLAEYKRLSKENTAMATQIMRYQSQLETLTAAVDEAEARLRRDVHREEAAALDRKLATLQHESDQLQADLDNANVDPATARQKLLAKVKADSQEVQALDGELKELKQSVQYKRAIARQLDSDLQRRQDGGEDDSAKYEQLFQRDAEMTEFIDRFPADSQKERAVVQRLRSTVAALLEHMSTDLERQHAMPTAAEAAEMAGDLDLKKRELVESKATQERLLQELRRNQEELQKVESLDEKIRVEISSLTEQMQRMQSEMATLQDLDSLRESAAAEAAALQARVQLYRGRREALRQQNAALSSQIERIKAAHARHASAKSLGKLEAKMQQFESSIHSMRQFIAARAGETDYETAREQVLDIVAKLNGLTKEAQAMVTTGIAATPY